MVECNLAKVEVEGSNPFSRSIFSRHSFQAGRRRQVVRQRSAKSLSAVRVRPAPPFLSGLPSDSKPFTSLDYIEKNIYYRADVFLFKKFLRFMIDAEFVNNPHDKGMFPHYPYILKT